MQFGVNINPSKPQAQEIESVAKWGVDFVELYIEPPFNTHDVLIKKAPLIKKVLQGHNLFAVGHAPPYCDLGSPDITVRAAWLIEMKRTIKAAAKLGLKRLDVHAHSSGMGFLTAELDKVVMENFIASFAFLVEAARPHGIIISIENTGEYPKEFAYLLSKVPGLHATLDIGHAFMRGGVAAIKAFTGIKAVDHLHINDATKTQDNLPLGEGKIPMKQVAEMLKKRGFAGTATVEVFGSKAEMKQSLEKFKELMR
ncbi:MAG: sugar phosphate isomerase/epimerase family protein [Candidatus Aenigmatarchaeota archaeon]